MIFHGLNLSLRDQGQRLAATLIDKLATLNLADVKTQAKLSTWWMDHTLPWGEEKHPALASQLLEEDWSKDMTRWT